MRDERTRPLIEPGDRAQLPRFRCRRNAASDLGVCRAITSAHSAGVALMATSNDRPTASRNEIDSGRKNAPCNPDIINIGRNATATAAVA